MNQRFSQSQNLQHQESLLTQGLSKSQSLMTRVCFFSLIDLSEMHALWPWKQLSCIGNTYFKTLILSINSETRKTNKNKGWICSWMALVGVLAYSLSLPQFVGWPQGIHVLSLGFNSLQLLFLFILLQCIVSSNQNSRKPKPDVQ